MALKRGVEVMSTILGEIEVVPECCVGEVEMVLR